MKRQQTKVLITGADGFIGKNLSEKLKDKYILLTPNRSELNLLNGDSVQKYFSINNIDVVVHGAIVGGSRKEEQINDSLSQNLRIFHNIINNRKYFHKIINLGSGAEYNKSFPIASVKESSFGKSVPTDDYGLFKYTCSKYIECLGIDNTIINLRIFGLYGKHEDYRYRFISNAIYRNIHGLPITLEQNVYFDYVYIDDFVSIIDYFIAHKANYKFYNIGSGHKIDLLSLAKKINSIAEKPSQIILTKQGLKNEYTCDNSRLLHEIKGLSFASYENCIEVLFNWYKNKKDFYDYKE